MTTIINTPSREDRLDRAFTDPVYFNRFYLPEWFPDRVPWFHRGVQAILSRQADFLLDYGETEKIAKHFIWIDDNKQPHPIFTFSYDNFGKPDGVRMSIAPNSNLIIPRGFSKTTVLNGDNVRCTAFKLFDYTLYIGESATHSQDQLAAVKREWEENELLIADFGIQAADRQDSRRWGADVIELRNGAFLRAIGRGGSVRGKQFRSKRPNRIILDDIEDEESVESDTQRRKTKNWFYGAVSPALPPMGRRKPTDGIVCLGTLLGSECLLRTIADDPTFNTVVLGAIDRDGEPLWPEQQSLEQLRIEREAAKRTGTLHIFSREKLSTIRTDENAAFREEDIIHEILDPTRLAVAAMACDPAISEKKTSDLFSIGVVAKDIAGKTWVLESFSTRGLQPSDQVAKFFEIRQRWKMLPCGLRYCGVETVAYQKALEYLIREEMARRNDYFELIPILHGKENKLTRIKGILQPRYRAKMVRHAERFASLEGNLRDFPNGKLDDIDAVAMGVALLEPHSGLAAPGDASPDEDEYDPLPARFGRGAP